MITKKTIKGFAKKQDNKLVKYAANYIVDQEDPESFIKDLLQHGCQSGMIGALIYYTDTVKFYKKYEQEITDLLKETMDSMGIYSLQEIFGNKFDKEDPLCRDTLNQNLLAWFGFEESVRFIADSLEIEW